MAQKQVVPGRKPRRITKPGFFFSLLKAGGMFLAAGGLILLIGSIVAGIVLLVRSAPDIISALSYSEQRFSGFFLMLLLAWLVVPLIAGGIGIVFLVVGLVCVRLATRPAVEFPVPPPPSDPDVSIPKY